MAEPKKKARWEQDIKGMSIKYVTPVDGVELVVDVKECLEGDPKLMEFLESRDLTVKDYWKAHDDVGKRNILYGIQQKIGDGVSTTKEYEAKVERMGLNLERVYIDRKWSGQSGGFGKAYKAKVNKMVANAKAWLAQLEKKPKTKRTKQDVENIRQLKEMIAEAEK